jgi:hypothetical protein
MTAPFAETRNTREGLESSRVVEWSGVECGEHDFLEHSLVDLRIL